ncbi:endo-1,4-beta-xylanase [Caldicellulosiruptoraceae bacterium PP1]
MAVSNEYKHRTAEVKLCLFKEDKTPIKNKEIVIRQTKHKFLFGGGGYRAIPLANDELSSADKDLNEGILSKFLDIFNYATLPFYWGRFEPIKGKPDTKRLKKACEWLRSKGCLIKGHPLCWHTVCAPWLLEMSNKEILQAQLNRIRREVNNFADLIDFWDVINEVVIMPIFDKYDNGMTRICKELGRVRLVREVFLAAKKANPDAILLINDFETSESYEILIEGCLEAGIPIDAIGIQSHMHQGYWGVEKTNRILERFSSFNLPIHFTENTIVSGHLMPPEIVDLNDYQVDEWPTTTEGEERQAKEVEMHYRTLFAHPLVESITWWDFTDGAWLKAPSGLIRKDGTAKPAYEVLKKLIKDEWWTKPIKTSTDDEGCVVFLGFLGEYEVEIEGKKVQFTLDKVTKNVEVTL